MSTVQHGILMKRPINRCILTESDIVSGQSGQRKVNNGNEDG